MFILDLNKLSVCLKAKRGRRGLRKVAKEINTLSPSTLSRIEGQRFDDITMNTFLTIVNWLEMEPSEFLAEDTDRKYFRSNYSVADEIKIILGASDIEPKYSRVLIAMMDAGLDTISRGKDE